MSLFKRKPKREPAHIEPRFFHAKNPEHIAPGFLRLYKFERR